MSDNRYTTFKITTRRDGSIKYLDFSSYAPDNGAVSAMMQPIIDAVAATANDGLQQRQQGREQDHELFAAMMKSAEDKAVDTAESAEREAETEADKAAEEACAAKAAEMTGSDETDNGASEASEDTSEDKAVDVAIAWLAEKVKPEKVAAIIKGWMKAIS